MNFLSFCCFLSVFYVALIGVTNCLPRTIRQVEVSEQSKEPSGKVQEQLLMAFDSFKKSMEELASKINTEEIVNGVQNLTSMLENYAKKTADQLASTASAIGSGDEKKE